MMKIVGMVYRIFKCFCKFRNLYFWMGCLNGKDLSFFFFFFLEMSRASTSTSDSISACRERAASIIPGRTGWRTRLRPEVLKSIMASTGNRLSHSRNRTSSRCIDFPGRFCEAWFGRLLLYLHSFCRVYFALRENLPFEHPPIVVSIIVVENIFTYRVSFHPTSIAEPLQTIWS